MAPDLDHGLVPGRILVVCTGNICRSPFVEHLLRDELDRAWGRGRIVVSSAGTQGLVGQPMNAESAAHLADLAGTANGFRARRLSPQDLLAADLVITATRVHRSAAVRMSPAVLRRSATLAEVALAREVVPSIAVEEPNVSAWLRTVSAAVVAHRPALVDRAPADLDLEDPYGREPAAHARMAAQVRAWMPSVAAVLSPTEAAAPRPSGPS
ncbi:MAG: low molecular weight phosphatase family protein [Ornithinimicrobium sp.]